MYIYHYNHYDRSVARIFQMWFIPAYVQFIYFKLVFEVKKQLLS